MLKVLMLRKKLDIANKQLAELRKKAEAFQTREAELEKAIAEAETEEEQGVVEENIEALEAEKATHKEEETNLTEQIRKIEEEIASLEQEQKTDQAPEARGKEVEETTMNTRDKFFGLSMQERDAMFARDDVKAYLANVRTIINEKRAVNNKELLIPQVFLGLLRENVMNYSKLYRHVRVVRVGGTGREIIMGTVPEAVWTECCATLNELSIGFNDLEVNCWKVGGYFALCNALLEDNDVNLATLILDVLGQSIGIALDKAILYGTGTRMPQGVVARLAQTEAPADCPETARTWVDLHTTNILSITAANSTGIKLFQAITTDAGAAKGRYSRGEKVWAMNETTYTKLVAEAMAVNAAGAIVAGVDGRMPVIGGVIEVLDFIPDNVIVGGYFDLYTLAERAGAKFASSEHVKFIEDQTVFKGTARYDGKPAIAEGFVVIGINGVTPTAAMTFAADTAN